MRFTRKVALLILLCVPLLANAGDISQDLIEAAKKGDTVAVKALLARGANVNAKDKKDATALIWVASWGHSATVQVLLAAGANVNAKDKDGGTALMAAAVNGHTNALQALLADGADVNAKDKDGTTALIFAARWGHTNALQALLADGADVNAKDEHGYTALIRAGKEGHTATLQALLDAGADVNAKNKEGFAALMMAVLFGHSATVQALLAAGADVSARNQDGYTALMWATGQGHTATRQALLDAGADVNAKTKEGFTALMVAANGGYTAAVQALLAAGANVNAKDKDGGTALALAARAGHTVIVELLKDRQEPPKRIRVSSIAQNSKLIEKIQPTYPSEAIQAGIEGTVKLEATIRDGIIQNLRVIDGHPMLAEAAIEAVQQWRYGPTLLDGTPLEVVTRIDVRFRLPEKPTLWPSDQQVGRNAIDFQEISFELPGRGWERTADESPSRIQFVRKYGEHRSQSIAIWPIGVPPALRGLSQEEHAVKYFDSERNLPRYQGRWEGFIEGEREISGRHYPTMSFRIVLDAGASADRLFLLYFPEDFEKRQRFYVLYWMDTHPAEEQGKGLDDLDALVASYRIRPMGAPVPVPARVQTRTETAESLVAPAPAHKESVKLKLSSSTKLILGVPFISWGEAARLEYQDKNILNPSVAASLGMVLKYWGQPLKLLKQSDKALPKGPEGWGRVESGRGKSLNDLKRFIDRGIPVIVSPAITPYAHTLSPTFFGLAQATGFKIKEKGICSGVLGRMVSLGTFRDFEAQFKLNPWESLFQSDRVVSRIRR